MKAADDAAETNIRNVTEPEAVCSAAGSVFLSYRPSVFCAGRLTIQSGTQEDMDFKVTTA